MTASVSNRTTILAIIASAPTANNCTDWQRNHNRWSNSQYQSFYRYHQRDPGFGGDALAAGIFGLAAGALIAGAVNNATIRALGTLTPARTPTGPTTSAATPIWVTTAIATSAGSNRGAEYLEPAFACSNPHRKDQP